ncbi:hypothetical protein J4440_06990 [Candidatus Woesearchaeota archaeon]|nr:hypothetical protein [Candidatus Woesearchaeota archaeon]
MAKAIFNGKLLNVNEVLSSISLFFVDGNIPDKDIPYAEKLDRSKLDFSVASLRYVDEYLKIVRKKKLNDRQKALICLRCGTYCGEVIRKNTFDLEWITYEQEILLENYMGKFKVKKDPIYSYFLYGKHAKSLSQPIQKVIKFFENGEGDSLEFFAKMVIFDNNNAIKFLLSFLKNPFPKKIPVVEVKSPEKNGIRPQRL